MIVGSLVTFVAPSYHFSDTPDAAKSGNSKGAGISTVSSEALLERMLTKIDGLCVERDRLKKELGPTKGKVLGGRSWA
jgi:hypothetical protein